MANPTIMYQWLTDDFQELGIDANGSVFSYDNRRGLWEETNGVVDGAYEGVRKPLAALASVMQALAGLSPGSNWKESG